MRRLAAVLVTCAFTSGLTAMAAQTSRDKPEPVSGTACVRAGVENGCVVLATTDGKTSYTVIGKIRPRVGSVVKFIGTTQPGVMTTCMQGVPIQLVKFSTTTKKCPLKD
jgi:hypothetical protein